MPPPPPPDELIVWLGHVPVIDTLVPATSEGVAVPLPPFATGNKPVTPVVNGKPVKLVAVPLDGVPNAPPVEYLLLNVFQSVDVRYPFAEVVAAGMLMTGAAPPEDTTGEVAVTPVTVPEPLPLNVFQSADVK
jgi:hypothetical protein